MADDAARLAAELVTLRDYLRYAVSRFRGADIFHGHGATTPLDEAAFIVLEALHLPVDDINPWLDARVTSAEGERLLGLIEERVVTRKPAAYLLNKAYIQGVPFYVDERVIVPRSFIGELLFAPHVVGGEGALIPDPDAIGAALDLCTGSGCLAILAAHRFANASVDAVDLSGDALAVARLNVDKHGLTHRVALHHGDLYAPLRGRRYDFIIANPPYVDDETMAMLPSEFRAEPRMALAGGGDGFDIVRRILAGARGHLAEDGALICEIGTDRAVLDAEFPDLPFLWLDTAESEGEVFWMARRTLPRNRRHDGSRGAVAAHRAQATRRSTPR